ncbi:hypothetical protein DV515_00010891 [Chloebia gouldiae]|uniref:RNase H type-1 domain-containing protein n=1 Tax=Chloebia gouldiae TaxID=44316 RepID=A0A3L8S958_CHLGU|nr:hypothetical protein DV515_00010891 [Chloebia gouldiae]
MVALAAIVVEEWSIFVETAKPLEYGVRNANLTPTIPSNVIIYHYMDDILFTQPKPFSRPQISDIKATLAQASLTIAPEKIQLSSPCKYLGWVISEQHIKPQKVQLHMDIQTLNDAQKLLGDLQWLRPIVGIPNELLATLRPLLQGTNPTHRIRISSEQRDALEKILDCVTQGQVFRRNLELPLDLTVWNGPTYLLAAITQLLKKTGEIRVLEWISPTLQQTKTLFQKIEMMAELIKKGRERLIEVTGTEPSTIRIPMKKDTFGWYLKTSQDLQEALLGGGSQIETDKLRPPPIHWMGQWDWIVRPKKEKNPIREAITAFTDAGKKSRTAAITWQEEGVWKQQLLHADPEDSLQTMELLAVIWALMELTGPLNVVTDSLYVAGVVDRIEEAFIREVKK